ADLKLFNCKNCPFADSCPYADPNRGYCEIEHRSLAEIQKEDIDELDLIKWIIKQLARRYIRARMFEDLAGGVLDRHTTTLETNLVRAVEIYFKLRTASTESGEGEDVLAELQKLAEAES
ncbi:MAG: hypothetical protein DRQ10_07625, partial [Candidatus Hydrothermota bacterium]